MKRSLSVASFIISLLFLAIGLHAQPQLLMKAGESLTSPETRYFPLQNCQISLQSDGNLVMRNSNGTPIWATGTASGQNNYWAILQNDGNLVIYRGIRYSATPSVAIYASQSANGVGSYFLGLSENYRLSIYKGTITNIKKIVWSNIRYTLRAGDLLQEGEILRDTERGIFLLLQSDGNLVAYFGTDMSNKTGVAWASNKFGSACDYYLNLQSDGNLVVYQGTPINPGPHIWTQKMGVNEYVLGFDPTTYAPIPEVWNFSVKVGITTQTANANGGFTAAREKVLNQFKTINSKFTTVFNGKINFLVKNENIYEVTGDARWEATNAPHLNFDYLVVYNHLDSNGGWFGNSQSIYHAWPGDIFGSNATDGLMHEFGHTRGALDLYGFQVDINPINGATYRHPNSIMQYPYGETIWDKHSISVANSNRDVAPASIDYILDSYPAEIIISVVDNKNIPVSGATVRLYPVNWFTYKVSTSVAYTYTTRADGTVRINMSTNNPFRPGDMSSAWYTKYPNFLVTATKNSLTATNSYNWMPIVDVQNAYTVSPGSPFRLTIKER